MWPHRCLFCPRLLQEPLNSQPLCFHFCPPGLNLHRALRMTLLKPKSDDDIHVSGLSSLLVTLWINSGVCRTVYKDHVAWTSFPPPLPSLSLHQWCSSHTGFLAISPTPQTHSHLHSFFLCAFSGLAPSLYSGVCERERLCLTIPLKKASPVMHHPVPHFGVLSGT